MSDVKKQLEEKLDKVAQGLFLMSVDRVRALSAHETKDLIEDLRVIVSSAKQDIKEL